MPTAYNESYMEKVDIFIGNSVAMKNDIETLAPRQHKERTRSRLDLSDRVEVHSDWIHFKGVKTSSRDRLAERIHKQWHRMCRQ